jgi:tetratricopeptide (TPR) repeat protein
VEDYFFISYSGGDGTELALRLADALVGGSPPHQVWISARHIRAGHWDQQLHDAIRDCRALILVMTKDSVRNNSSCKYEWAAALRYKRHVLPLRFDPDADLPLRLSSLQYIDFTAGHTAGLARLRETIDWMSSPAGVLQDLRSQREDLEREVLRARDDSYRNHLLHAAEQVRARIAEHENVVRDPTRPVAQTLERSRQAQASTRRATVVNQAPATVPAYFQDRHLETRSLVYFLHADDTRVATVVGRGGIGKTAMVCRLLQALESGRLPDGFDGNPEPAPIDGFVYLRTPSTRPATFANLFADLCRLLPDQSAQRLTNQYRDRYQTSTKLTAALLDAFPPGRSIVLLDNFEDHLDPVTGTVLESELDEALRTVLSTSHHGLKILITSRVAPRPLLLHEPGRQLRIDLDEGLPSPFAERLLRARDPDGKLGIKTAPDELLTQARERTRGYPRALEAFAGILSADRSTTLLELLEETADLPDNVVAALVGEAFARLDPAAQAVMTALATFPVPVPAAAVDHVLRSYGSTVAAEPVLRRLVNMRFVRRESDCYHLHQVDRAHVLGLIGEDRPDSSQAGTSPVTRAELYRGGADYFAARPRPPREKRADLRDVVPQLAEFELRCHSGNFERAALVLFDIDDHLVEWGHYNLTVELHNRLDGHLSNPGLLIGSALSLGSCHYHLGNYSLALKLYDQALTVAQNTGNREAKSVILGRLGLCYAELGDAHRAADFYKQAIAAAQDAGDAMGVSAHLGNLGLCFVTFGEFDQAIALHDKALATAKAVGDRHYVTNHLVNLGLCHAALGRPEHAIGLYEQAFSSAEQIGFRLGQAVCLDYRGVCTADLGDWPSAAGFHRRAIEIADRIGSAPVQAEARHNLLQTLVWAGDLTETDGLVAAAKNYLYPYTRAGVALLDAVIRLRHGALHDARQAFGTAIYHADKRLRHNVGDYHQLDVKALALTGLTLIGPTSRASEAADAFRAARSRTDAPGVVGRIDRYLGSLEPVDSVGAIGDIRPVAINRAT